MDMTTTARVKLRLGLESTDTEQDTLLSIMVTRASADAERIMNRDAQAVSRTKAFDVSHGMLSLSLPAYPITTMTSVHNDVDRAFGSETLVATADYVSEAESGVIWFEIGLIPGRQVMQVIWLGGMGTTSSDFIINYPDVADAVDQRVCQLWQRRNEVGLQSVASAQGNVSVLTQDWPMDTLEVLYAHRRMSHA